MNIQQYLTENKKKIDDALLVLTAEDPSTPKALKEAMEYSLKAGGKRLRPILAIAANRAVGGDVERVLPFACALEMIHTFSLIHDDLPAMDDDDFRRGLPTNHKIFGEGIAVLAGDGLLTLAFEILSCGGAKNGVDAGRLLEVIRDLAQATGPSGMVGGQVLDLKAEGASLDAAALENVHRFKTGRLISVSVTGGAKIAGADAKKLEALKSYGDKIGLAFQIADDILNVEGDAKTLGKSVGSDAKNCKSTYPAILGLEQSKTKARELVSEAIAALDGFDAAADPLRGIAEYVVLRKS